MIKIIFVIKIKFYLDYGNLGVKNLNKTETFQHYHVFVTVLIFTFVVTVNNYLILKFEVKVITNKNLINLNKKYENNLQKVVIFIAILTL